ncbi:DBH-like monooxygenase protein 1 [Seminavis robusta]|uniref:DBH-like monooxygenase protein 1 n=1 Tax=Seminavis robusta TaxID=568900 RepID=A0A9N8D8L1_9STRA|nr:DBH-like monooxygenase protein 1 [Seminavis robusta]|eukprot:Sro38_g023540.1 DBH-like monooxygenase protein 1 (727) ;mRNA; f:7569-9862
MMLSSKKLAAQLVWLSCLLAVASGQGDACFDERSSKYFSKNDWKYCQQLEPNLFMYYAPLVEDQGGNVMLGLHATSDTTGWTALALAGNGGMKGASQIVVRRDNDNGNGNDNDNTDWVAEDRYSTDYSTPLMDESQDVKLLFADQTDEGETAWGVLLMINPCDEPFDYPIEDKSTYMHWAAGSDHTFSFHGNKRGQFHANLFQAPQVVPSTEGLDYIDFVMPNVPVVVGEGGTDPTNPYICGFFDLDEIYAGSGHSSQDKIHAIHMTPVIAETSKKYVHHQILYECSFGGADSQFDDDDDDATPVDVDNLQHLQIVPECESMPPNCWEMKYGWAVGGQDIILPDDVGIPFGEGKRWLALQVHYYNPNLDEGVTDSSGVRVYISPEVRSQDAAIMEFDSGTVAYQRPPMPMGVANYELPPFVVPSSCTSSVWNQPLNILGVFHHLHRLGRQMELVVERDGQNLGPLRKEFGYDFNHQTIEESPFKELLPGDQIVVKCSYDTTSATKNVSFGELTQDEMCYGGVLYYPRQQDDLFHYYPPQANPSSCSAPGTGEWANVSRCAQAFSESVPKFFDYEMPFDFDAVTMCNADWFESEVGWFFDDICPTCQATQNCTVEEVATHAQEDFCVRWCSENANLSLYPDLSRTDPHDTGAWGCPNELFKAPVPLDPPVCETIGDLSLEIPESAAGNRTDDDLVSESFSGADGVFSSPVPSILSATTLILLFTASF